MNKLEDELWNVLWDEEDGPDDYPNARPLLAHYTSAATAESIFIGKQLWLSHPLLMNDVEELQWGIQAASKIIAESGSLESACGDRRRFFLFCDAYDQAVQSYGQGHAKSIFITCFSRHEADDHDGILSMWRAYSTNGEGVAIVLDTSKIEPQHDIPFILGPVKYCSPEERRLIISTEVEKICQFFKVNNTKLDDKFIATSAYFFFEKIKLISLTTKHKGFREENEWRLIYFSERDEQGLYSRHIGYASGMTGFQPKLKIPMDGTYEWAPQLSELVSGIILGPSHGSHLAVGAFQKMLELNGFGELASRVRRSEIPFRSRGI